MSEEENTSSSESEELVLTDIVEVAPEDLTEEQAGFLKENAEELSDEQKETFKEALKEEEEEEEEVDPEKIEVETRSKVGEKKKKEGEEEEEEVDPDDEKTISKVVDQKLKEAGVGAAKDQIEVDAFIRSKPELGKYRGVILKYMKSPAYSNIPVHNIAAMVSAKDQQKLGAQKEREADQKVKETQTGGKTVRKPGGGKIDWANATPEQIADKKQEILDQSRQ